MNLKGPLLLTAWYCQSDWARPNSMAPPRTLLRLNNDPAVAMARHFSSPPARLTSRQMARLTG